MLEGKRQKQVASVLERDFNSIFQKLGLSMMDGGMISISTVKVTPDLHEARVYLSFYNVKDPVTALKTIQDRDWEIKKMLTASIKHQFRTMPVLSYYIDDTLDYADKIETLFKEIKKEDSKDSDKS